MKRFATLFPLAAGALLSLSACGNKEPGEDAAATVNGHEITIAEINAELAERGAVNAEDPNIREAALQAVINRKLLADFATGSDLDRTPEFILKEQRMRELLLADAAMRTLSPETSREDEQAIEDFLATNLAGNQRTMYLIEGMAFARPEPAVVERLGNASSLEQIRAIIAEANIEAEGGNLTWDSAQLPTDLVRRLNALPAGEPFIMPQGAGVIAGIVRETRQVPVDPAQSRNIAAEVVSRQGAAGRVNTWLEEARSSAEIAYGEGFGSDAATGADPETAPASEEATPAA